MTENSQTEKASVTSTNTRWLANIPDAIKIKHIPVIPGTHNSATHKAKNALLALPWIWAQCQNIGIRQQLLLGIRVLDLRVTFLHELVVKRDETLRISHSYMTNQTLASVINDCVTFLNENPSEFVIVRFKRDWPHRTKWCSMADDRLHDVIRECVSDIRYTGSHECNGDTLVQELRGRIMFVCPDDGIQFRFPRNLAFALQMDIWNCKNHNNAKKIIFRYAYEPQERCKSFAKKYVKSIGANVVEGGLPPRMVASGMNRWLIKLLNEDLAPSTLDRPACCSNSSTLTTPALHHQNLINLDKSILHIGILTVDFCDATLVDRMIKASYRMFKKMHTIQFFSRTITK